MCKNDSKKWYNNYSGIFGFDYHDKSYNFGFLIHVHQFHISLTFNINCIEYQHFSLHDNRLWSWRIKMLFLRNIFPFMYILLHIFLITQSEPNIQIPLIVNPVTLNSSITYINFTYFFNIIFESYWSVQTKKKTLSTDIHEESIF